MTEDEMVDDAKKRIIAAAGKDGKILAPDDATIKKTARFLVDKGLSRGQVYNVLAALIETDAEHYTIEVED